MDGQNNLKPNAWTNIVCSSFRSQKWLRYWSSDTVWWNVLYSTQWISSKEQWKFSCSLQQVVFLCSVLAVSGVPQHYNPKWCGKASTFSHAHLTIASEQQPQPCRPLIVITSEWYGWSHPEPCTCDEQALSAIMQHKWIVLFWVHPEVKWVITDLRVHLSLIPLDICVCKYMCMKRLTPPNKKTKIWTEQGSKRLGRINKQAG